MEPVTVTTQIGNARERFEALQQGRKAPKKTYRAQVGQDQRDQIDELFSDIFAGIYLNAREHNAQRV